MIVNVLWVPMGHNNLAFRGSVLTTGVVVKRGSKFKGGYFAVNCSNLPSEQSR